MDVIGFLRVSLGSSTVQLHDRLGSRSACAYSEARFSSQNGDRTWGVYYRWAAFCCAFLWAKGLNAKYIRKEMFPVYGGKCLSRKAIHNWLTNVSLMAKRLKREVRKWLRQQSKDVYVGGLDTVVERWDKCINVGGAYVEKQTFFFVGSNITCFTFYIHLWPIYGLSLAQCLKLLGQFWALLIVSEPIETTKLLRLISCFKGREVLRRKSSCSVEW
jgi:hypothetical protein